MKIGAVYPLTVLLLCSMILSCKNPYNPANQFLTNYNKKINVNKYCRIKLTPEQIKVIGSERFVRLTSGQSELLQNKINEFHVDGPKSTKPEGWFSAKWIKPDTLLINKYLIDSLDQTIIANNKICTKDLTSGEMIINIDLNGRMYLSSKEMSEHGILLAIQKMQKDVKKELISIYVSYAPFDSEKIKINTYTKVKRINEYCMRSSIHFQDDF